MADNPVCWTRSGTGCGASITASGPSRRMGTGSGASCCITTSGTPGHGGAEVEAFLIQLAVAKRCRPRRRTRPRAPSCSSTRRSSGSLCRGSKASSSTKRPERLPVVLTREEVESILTHRSGTAGLMIRLLYGTGIRIMECVRLRVKDVDFARGEIVELLTSLIEVYSVRRTNRLGVGLILTKISGQIHGVTGPYTASAHPVTTNASSLAQFVRKGRCSCM